MIEQLVFWMLTGVVIVSFTLLGILFKKNLDANTKQAEAVTELTKQVAVLSTSLTNFQTNCQKTETTNTKRLNNHADDIKGLREQGNRHDIQIEEHGRRINHLEQK